MAEPIKISLDASKYILPTQDDVKSAKQYVLRRERTADVLERKVDEVLENASERIVTICYRYGVDPYTFTITSDYNEKMMEEVSTVMDEVEMEILDLIYEYSVQPAKHKDMKSALALWIASLGRGNRNLQDTLDTYLFKYLKDMEAAIAALSFMGVNATDAVTRAKSSLHSVYTMPEVRTAIRTKQHFKATYIRLGGVQPGAVGISNNGSTNVVNMSRLTLQMAWMREKQMEYKEEGALMYTVQRGSLYLCDLCDEHVGTWPIEDTSHFPPIHGHCCCWAMPIYGNVTKSNKGRNNDTKKQKVKYKDENYTTIDTENGRVRVHKKHGKKEKSENINIATYLANKHGYHIDILPKDENAKSADSYNRTLDKKQEYKVNSTPTKSSIDNLIRDAKKQANSIVIRLDSDISLDIVSNAINDRLKRAENVTDITLIKNGKDVTYSREQMTSKSFKIKPEDFD